jgi:hypothetical protein
MQSDPSSLGGAPEKDDLIVAMAAGAAVLGHPEAAPATSANRLGARGQQTAAGTFSMTSGVTEAIPVAAGDHIDVRFQDLGSVPMRLVRTRAACRSHGPAWSKAARPSRAWRPVWPALEARMLV